MGDNYRDQYSQRPSSANPYAPHQSYQPQQYAGRPNDGYSPYSSTANFQPPSQVWVATFEVQMLIDYCAGLQHLPASAG
jgi:hypothetical protein